MATSARRRLFLDTNVLFSALYSQRGAPNRLLTAFMRGQVTIVVSQLVLDELVGALRAKSPNTLPDLRELLLNHPPEVWPDAASAQVAPWLRFLALADAAILAAAISAKPDYFVTGDKRFLVPAIAERSGLRIVTPAEALERLI